MGAFLSYMIVSGLLLLALYLGYRLFLAADNQHGFNRGVLLAIYALAFSAPAIFTLPMKGYGSAAPIVNVEGMEMTATPIGGTAGPMWGTVLIWIFMTGMAVVAVMTAVTWLRLCTVIRRGEKMRREGYTLVVTDDERLAPFSWMHYVVVSRADYEGDCGAIATHELSHVARRHWADLLVAQVVCIVNWFNPAAWLMRDELMLVHEYQADMAVIDAGHDAQAYQMLLIRKAVGSRFPSLANSLNHSKLKKRITMMHKSKSGAGRRLRALALVPTLALALAVAGIPAVRAAVTTIGGSDVTVGKSSEKSPVVQIGPKTFSEIPDDVKVVVDGTEVSKEEVKAIDPATIKSIDVLKDANEIRITTKKIPVIVIDKPLTAPDGVKIFIDGKEVSQAELNSLDPATIAAIDVDKDENAIRITLKK